MFRRFAYLKSEDSKNVEDAKGKILVKTNHRRICVPFYSLLLRECQCIKVVANLFMNLRYLVAQMINYKLP